VIDSIIKEIIIKIIEAIIRDMIIEGIVLQEGIIMIEEITDNIMIIDMKIEEMIITGTIEIMTGIIIGIVVGTTKIAEIMIGITIEITIGTTEIMIIIETMTGTTIEILAGIIEIMKITIETTIGIIIVEIMNGTITETIETTNGVVTEITQEMMVLLGKEENHACQAYNPKQHNFLFFLSNLRSFNPSPQNKSQLFQEILVVVKAPKSPNISLRIA